MRNDNGSRSPSLRAAAGSETVIGQPVDAKHITRSTSREAHHAKHWKRDCGETNIPDGTSRKYAPAAPLSQAD